MPKDCCKSGKKDKSCRRRKDGKVFSLPRKFPKKKCMEGVKGFTMRSSCAPYKDCKKGRSTRRKSKKRNSTRRRKSKKRNSTRRRKSARRKTKKKGYSSYRKKDSTCTNDKIDIFSSDARYDLLWNTNNLSTYPDKIKITANSGTIIYTHIENVYKDVGLYSSIKYGQQIILKFQTSQTVDSNGTCGLIKSKKIAEISLNNGKTVYVNLMNGFTGDLNNMREKNHLSLKPQKGKLDIIKIYQRVKDMLICLSDKNLYYTDLKMANILCCLDKVGETKDFSLYLGDIDSAVGLGESGVTTYPPPEYSGDPGNVVIDSNDEGKRFLSWQLGVTILELYNRHFAMDLYWKRIENKSVDDIYKIVKNNIEDVEKDSQFGSVITILKETLSEKRKPIDELPNFDTSPKSTDVQETMKRPKKRNIDEVRNSATDKFVTAVREVKGRVKRGKPEVLNSGTGEITTSDWKAMTFNSDLTDNYKKAISDKLAEEELIYGISNMTLGNSTKKKKRKSLKTREFLFNPNDPKKSFDVYIDKNPKDTIPIKYRTYTDTKNTVRKLESLYKKGKYPHKRIFQVAMILRVRLKVLKKDKKRAYELACRYYDFIKSRTKIKGEKARKKLSFKY